MAEQGMEDHRRHGDSSTGRDDSRRAVEQRIHGGAEQQGQPVETARCHTGRPLYPWHICRDHPYPYHHPLYIDSRDFPEYYMENVCFTLDTPPSYVL
jgi:hypothetical protein